MSDGFIIDPSLPFKEEWDKKSPERQRIHTAFAERFCTHPGTQACFDALKACDEAIEAEITARGIKRKRK